DGHHRAEENLVGAEREDSVLQGAVEKAVVGMVALVGDDVLQLVPDAIAEMLVEADFPVSVAKRGVLEMADVLKGNEIVVRHGVAGQVRDVPVDESFLGGCL